MNIIDLFSGAGGLTFGFYYNLQNGQFVRSDNNFIFANEYSVQAATAFSENFPDIHMENCDIRQLSREHIEEQLPPNCMKMRKSISLSADLLANHLAQSDNEYLMIRLNYIKNT